MAHGCVRLGRGVLLLDRRLLSLAVVALAMVPAVADDFLDFLLDLHDHLFAIHALAAIDRIQLILLNDVDEFGRVVDVLGISAVPEPLRPAAVVGHVKLVQDSVARAIQELGVVDKGILGTAIFAIAHGAQGVAPPIDFALPVIGLDAEVVVGFNGHLALAHITLEQPLSEGDAGGNTIITLRLQRHLLVTLDVVKISLMFGLCRCPKG